MKDLEIIHILIAILILSAVVAFKPAIEQNLPGVGLAILFSTIIIIVTVVGRKIAANLLDSDVEHKVWMFSRYGYRPNWHLETSIPAGIILPLFLSFFSLGIIKFPTILQYETKALKVRAARRFGFYSYTEMTEWHNALIGAAGIISVLLLSFLSYFPGLEGLSKICAFYAISNILPIAKLDGTQILAGSKILYITLLIVTLIFFAYALLLV